MSLTRLLGQSMWLCMWSVVLSCFPYLVSFNASPSRYEALWNVTAFQHSHGSVQIFGWLTLCFFYLCFGLQRAKSPPSYAQRDWVCHKGVGFVTRVPPFSCQILRVSAVLPKMYHVMYCQYKNSFWAVEDAAFSHISSFPDIFFTLMHLAILQNLLLCYCFLFFQEVVHWSMHSLLFELQKHINPMFCKT